MWWSFKNALARKLAYVLLALAAALIFGHRAHAQGQVCYVADGGHVNGAQQVGGPGATYEAAMQSGISAWAAASGFVSGSVTSCSPSGVPTSTAGATCQIQTCTNYPPNEGYPPNSCGSNTGTVGAESQACPSNPCSAKASQTFIVQGTSGPITGTTGGTDSCQYQVTDGVSLAFGIPAGMTLQTMTATGAQQSGTAQVGPQEIAGQDANACVTMGGNTTCLTLGADTSNCGYFNGDAVCVGKLANNTCAATASGGAVCAEPMGTAPQAPPAPDNGTAGTPAAAVAQLTAPDGTTSLLYSAAQVKGSAGGVNTTGTTGTTSNPTGTAGAGTQAAWNGCLGTSASPCVTVQAPSAVNGDCGATGTCSSDGVVPTLATVPSVGDSLSSYWTALGNVPLVAAFSSISNSLPSAECPTYQFSMFQQTFTMDQQCTVFGGMGSLLAAVMIAVYTLTGMRILMST